MSTQSVNGINIPVVNNKKNINFQQMATVPQYTNQTAMQGAQGDAIKQSVDNSYIANRARASQDNNPVAVAGLGAASWYGIAQGMEKLNYKSGEAYEKTIYGKLGALGDKFSEKTWVGKKLQTAINWTSATLERLSGKSKIVNSLMHHSTTPEWSYAKTPAKGPLGFLCTDAETVLEEFLKPITGQDRYSVMGFGFGGKVNYIQKLEQYGMSQKDINALKESLKGESAINQALAIQRKEIQLLGASPEICQQMAKETDLSALQEIAKELKVKKLGLKDMAEFQSLKGTLIDNPEKAFQIFENASKDPQLKHVSIWRNETSFFGKIKSHLFGRRVRFSEYANKFKVSLGKGNTSTLGRMLPKGLSWLLEGGTNRFAGGKLGVALQAGILADILYNTIKAKGERIKTFAERCVNDFTYFVGMTVGIIAMHKVGGFKYAGLKDAKAVEAYREAKKALDARTIAKEFNSKKEWKAALKELNQKHLGLENIKNPITKLLQKIGSFINMGNESNATYISKSKFNMNWLRKIANKNLIGVPMRFLIPMAVVTPFLVKLTTSAAHKIFGRPTHSVLDEEEETPEETQHAVQNNPNAPNAANQAGAVPPTQQPQEPKFKDPQEYGDSNLIKTTINGKKPNVRTYIPSPECGIPQDGRPVTNNGQSYAPKRSYIPSPEAAQITGPDLTTANQAIAEADMTEKFINETLASMR